MKILHPFCLSGAFILCQCTRVEIIPDSLIPYEFAGHSAGVTRESYTLRELVYALPHVWEVNPIFRGAFLEKLYPESSGGMPEDFAEVQTAHGDFVVTRLEKDLVAVATHAELIDMYDRIYILRRVPGGWQDMTSHLFPFTFDRESRVTGFRNKAIVVREPHGAKERKYRWNGNRFLLDQTSA